MQPVAQLGFLGTLRKNATFLYLHPSRRPACPEEPPQAASRRAPPQGKVTP
jgi:hypothetical protein